MKPHEELEWHKKLRSIEANRTDNIYELTRMRIVRVMRECEDVSYAAEELGCSRATVRRYMNFVPFEHLMRDPSLEKRFRLAEHDRYKMGKTASKASMLHLQTAEKALSILEFRRYSDCTTATGASFRVGR
ncbi:MAG: hypothetical protein J5858_01320, partial [Lentisphaeria bacterium]|nr:hypothetical protein [Lentisphaeria bacterium]